MNNNTSFHFRKFTDINRDYPLFELLDGETIIFDIGLSDEGSLEIAFHEGASNRVLKLDEFLKLLEEGRKLVAKD